MLETPESLGPRSGKAPRIGLSADKSYAYLLGVFLGDGCVTRYNNGIAFRMNTIDEDFALAVKAALGELTEVPTRIWKYSVKKSSKPNFSLCCADQKLCNNLRSDTSNKTRIPLNKLEANEGAFVIGLMDSEGFVAKKTGATTEKSYYMGFKSCDVWVPKFVSLLQSLGLKIGKVSQCPPYKAHYKTPTRFHIKMQSWVNSGLRFNIKRKQDRVDVWANTMPYANRTTKKELISETTRQGAYACA